MGNTKTINQAKYDSVNTRHFHIKYNNKTDADILSWLESKPSIQGYIKQLIRADIATHAQGTPTEGEDA